MSSTESVNKSAFVRDFLAKNPTSTPATVIEAWNATGLEGTISASLVRGIRLKMKKSDKAAKVTGSAPKKRKTSKRKRIVAAKKEVAAAKKEVPAVKKVSAPKRVKAVPAKILSVSARRSELEAEIDRLLFKVMGLGGFPQTEDHLRKARRSLYEAK